MAPDDGVLERHIEQVLARAKSAGVLEQRDPRLAAALATLKSVESAGHHRSVAEAYLRAGVRDSAYDHFAAAARLDPHDAVSLDNLARLWRDWGFPQLGLTQAYQAVYWAPTSPAPVNTLGTVLLRLGLLHDARQAFERALALDAQSTYALNNLCWVSLLEGDSRTAIGHCQAALAIDPELTAAHNNLALAYAASGDMLAAQREFARAGVSSGVAEYNLGVALLAVRQYDAAARAFDTAAVLLPASVLARQRAFEARQRDAAAQR